MPEYLAPGVYVEEVSSGIKPIEGVSTSTAGFMGRTERGPIGAHFITSFADYQRLYGGFLSETDYLPDAIKGFYDNGGKRAFVARDVLPDDEDVATADLSGFTFQAIGPGSWGTRIRVLLVEATLTPIGGPKRLQLWIDYFRNEPGDSYVNSNSDWKLLKPKQKISRPDSREVFDNLSNIEGSPNDIMTVVNQRSNLVRIVGKRADNPAGLSLAKAQSTEEKWTKLDAGEPPPAPKDGTPARTALQYLEEVDGISLVIAPDISKPGDIIGLVTSCERLRDRVVLLPSTLEDNEIPNNVNLKKDTDSSYAAFYHPWIKVSNAGTIKRIPPVGHIAGICARSDIARGVHKAPANEVVLGAIDLETPINKEVQDMLNPLGVNCIRDFRPDGRGIRLWGARTTSSDAEWKYLNVRRLFLFVEESIDQGTQWAVFEPNSDPTWAAMRRNISNFLTSVWRSGALLGNTPEEAFFVRCDRTTMTEDDILNGRLVCVIGIAPVRPAEFVIIRISQMTADAQA
ncbi:tail protein [Mesorhizobium sp. LSJC269B00]|uniref:phage tail sheath family protein n=1 Tax=Mesorhizobium sp. LSJC269B00 TaxID=1287326 RepID=UPI0003CE82A1|nr:phage tail sheath subtilisin-like domain-containing protein [Mesorhizobium sp. LSJC269B00]ESW93133.1 tail protein [Mesorhizobium sp. LSJC269B00]